MKYDIPILLTLFQTISTTTITFPAISKAQAESFDKFLRTVLWEEELPGSLSSVPFEIHRLKGRIPVIGGNTLLVQGVRNIYEMSEANSDQNDYTRDEEAKLVLIGKAVDQPAFWESLVLTLDS